jgi:tetratricopeptide (TPR) repeat protein
MRADLAWVPFACALLGCAPSYAKGYESAFAEGMRAQNAGRFEEANAAFERAARLGDRYKDRDEARLHAAEALERLERYADAEATYARVIRDSGGRYQGIRAEFLRARLVLDHVDGARGEKLLFDAAANHPSSGLSRHAMKRLLAIVMDRDGDDAGLALLQRYPAKGTDLEEAIAYERGLILMKLGRYAEARDGFLASARAFPYPHGALTDDAYFQASICEERLSRPEEAVKLLREMLSVKEAAYSGSSYERPRFPDAQLRIARLYRDVFRDAARARAEFAVFVRDHGASRFVDDALWERALLERSAGEAKAVCATMTELIELRPQSRFTHCAVTLCPGAPATPRACPEYVLRDAGLIEGDMSTSDASP